MWISPKHRTDEFEFPLNIDDLITIHEDRVQGWFLNIAQALIPNHANDFVILMIVAAFFEGHTIFLNGADSKDQSGKFFKQGFKAVMQNQWIDSEAELDAVAHMLWSQVRNGLFHTGMIYSQAALYRGTDKEQHPPVKVYREELMPGLKGPDYLVLNAPKLLEIVQAYFSNYIAKLRDPSEVELRNNFQKGWEIQMSMRNS